VCLWHIMVGLVKSDFEDNGTAAMKLLDHFALPPALMQPQTTNIVPSIERGAQATSSQACSVSTPAYANLKAALRFTQRIVLASVDCTCPQGHQNQL
jgi:hypothetical protein